MIKVKIVKEKNFINQIEVSGHSNANEQNGKLVCAGVSALAFGILNALNTLENPNDVEKKVLKNKIIIKVHKQTQKSKIILETFYIQLLTIETDNKKYIKFI